MITEKGENVEIKLEMQELEESIALLTGLKRYCDEERTEEGVKETSRALQVAIEAMQALWILIERGGFGSKQGGGEGTP